MGKLGVRTAVEALLKLTKDADPSVRRSSFDSLRLLKEARAVPLAVAALADSETEMEALQCVGALGGSEHAKAVSALAQRHPSADILLIAAGILTRWRR